MDNETAILLMFLLLFVGFLGLGYIAWQQEQQLIACVDGAYNKPYDTTTYASRHA